jgi:hypothetical protein
MGSARVISGDQMTPQVCYDNSDSRLGNKRWFVTGYAEWDGTRQYFTTEGDAETALALALQMKRHATLDLADRIREQLPRREL